MAQTSGATSVAIIKTVIANDGATARAAAELDHATKVETEVQAVASAPTDIETTVLRTPHGLDEICTILIWTSYTP